MFVFQYNAADIITQGNELLTNTTEDILKVIKTTKSISSMLKDKIESIRKTIEKI